MFRIKINKITWYLRYRGVDKGVIVSYKNMTMMEISPFNNKYLKVSPSKLYDSVLEFTIIKSHWYSYISTLHKIPIMFP